jgi:hypothetical protein
MNPIHDDSGDDSEVEPYSTKRDWNRVRKFHAELDKVKMKEKWFHMELSTTQDTGKTSR